LAATSGKAFSGPTSTGGGAPVLWDRIGLIALQDIVGEAPQPSENAGDSNTPGLIGRSWQAGARWPA